MFYEKTKNILFCCFIFAYTRVLGLTARPTQDQPSTKANTLSDDADDIQKQLENEARDKIKFGQAKTIWVFHLPTHMGPNHGMGITESLIHKREQYDDAESTESMTFADAPELEIKDWNYRDQNKWPILYPACGGTSQSPVNLPVRGMVHTKASRDLQFDNYDKLPNSMTVVNDGRTVTLFGEWDVNSRPVIHGGAAHSRRYLFHSLALRFPSEHTVGGLTYPMESQALHVSIEYATFDDAIKAAARDKLALLIVANIYVYSDHNHEGLEELLKAALSTSFGNSSIRSLPLNVFSPVLKEYATYHGSLTVPPCTESVLWLVRARSLPIKRELAEFFEDKITEQHYGEPGQSYNRLVQPLNDRKVYFFK